MGVNTGRKPAEDIFNGYKLNESAVCKLIKKEIYSPDMVWIFWFGQCHLGHGHFFVFPRPLSLQIKAFVNPIDSFMVDLYFQFFLCKDTFEAKVSVVKHLRPFASFFYYSKNGEQVRTIKRVKEFIEFGSS